MSLLSFQKILIIFYIYLFIQFKPWILSVTMNRGIQLSKFCCIQLTVCPLGGVFFF